MKQQTLIPIMICLVIGNSVLSQDNSLSSGDRFKEVDDQIAKHVVDNHIPGLAYAVVQGDQMLWSGGAGWANMEREIPECLP